MGERWGKKWHVSVHLREQGRPQGASFSAGDLSHNALAAQRFPGIVVFPSYKYPAIEANGIERMEELADRLEMLDEFSDEHENLRHAVRLVAATAVRHRGTDCVAGGPGRACRHYRQRGLCRARQELSDLGARRGFAEHAGEFARTRPPARDANPPLGSLPDPAPGMTRQPPACAPRRRRQRRSTTRVRRLPGGACAGAGRGRHRGAGAARRRALCRRHFWRRRL